MKITELFNVSGKIAIVTGGSRGIGEMIAAGFLANGVKVYITARKEAALIEKAKELSDLYGADCIPVPCDLSTMHGMEEFVTFMESKEEHIDFLINNAGASWGEPYAEYSEKGWDKVMDLNVKSIFYLTQKLTPMLSLKASAEDPSRVINIGSVDGLNVPVIEAYAYGTSKAAVHHLTRIMAKRLVGENILVNAIAPGPVDTDMLDINNMTPEWREKEEQIPMERIGKPEEISGMAVYLASEYSSFVTGQIFGVNGGSVMP